MLTTFDQLTEEQVERFESAFYSQHDEDTEVVLEKGNLSEIVSTLKSNLASYLVFTDEELVVELEKCQRQKGDVRFRIVAVQIDGETVAIIEH